jgi:hypothetical protein
LDGGILDGFLLARYRPEAMPHLAARCRSADPHRLGDTVGRAARRLISSFSTAANSSGRLDEVCFAPTNGHRQTAPACPFGAKEETSAHENKRRMIPAGTLHRRSQLPDHYAVDRHGRTKAAAAHHAPEEAPKNKLLAHDRKNSAGA